MDTSKVAWHSDIRTAGIDRFCAVACWKGEKSVSVMVDKNEAMSMRNTLNVRGEKRRGEMRRGEEKRREEEGRRGEERGEEKRGEEKKKRGV